MKSMKRFGAMLLALMLAVSLAACGKGSSVSSGTSGSDDGYHEGRLGDLMTTSFFGFVVSEAYTCDSFGDYVPAEGNQMLVVKLGVKNTMNESIPMYDTDFQIQWDDEADMDNAYSNPIPAESSDELLPEEYELGVDEQADGLLAFEVPGDVKDYSLVYLEEFDDDTTGDFFAVFFTAKPQDGAV